MPKFAYIGDEPSVFAFGLTFPRDVPIEVTDTHALRKLPNHPHFRSVANEPAPMVLAAEAPEIGAALTPEPTNALLTPPKRRGRPKKETTE